MDELAEALRALYKAIWEPPTSIQEAQKHQAEVIPDLRDKLHIILTYEFSRAELALLREELEEYEDLEHEGDDS